MPSSARRLLPITALLMIPIAEAHVGAGPVDGFVAGIAHPLGGADHLLAMLAVGLWATQMRAGVRNAPWALPTVFILFMIAGSLLACGGLYLPFVEQGIAVSVLLLGALIAAAVRLPLLVSLPMVGLVALFHGHAHGNELPVVASAFRYSLGFVLATLILLACGVGLGRSLEIPLWHSRLTALRLSGLCIAASGVSLVN